MATKSVQETLTIFPFIPVPLLFQLSWVILTIRFNITFIALVLSLTTGKSNRVSMSFNLYRYLTTIKGCVLLGSTATGLGWSNWGFPIEHFSNRFQLKPSNSDLWIVVIIHQTHYEKSDWSRAFNQFTIACELDMINVITAADITLYHVKFNVCLVTKPLGVFSSETKWLNASLLFLRINYMYVKNV